MKMNILGAERDDFFKFFESTIMTRLVNSTNNDKITLISLIFYIDVQVNL